MTELFRRLRYLLNRRRLEQELADDLEVHRELAARAGDRQPFGDTLRLREEARDAWGWTWIDRFGQDLRYAFRMLRKSPGFTAMAVLMLAVGIGINVAAFGFFNLMVLRPLPVRDPDTILRFQRSSPEHYSSTVSYPAMVFYREQSRTLSAVLAAIVTKVSLEGEGKSLSAEFVTANFFDELGGTTALGRRLDSVRDEAVDAPPVVVLGYWFWERRFGHDPSIVGKTLRLNGKPATVVGVASPDFTGLHADQPDLWLPITQQPYFVGGSLLIADFAGDHESVNMWGRLQPGVTPKQAEEELRSLASALRRQHPDAAWDKESLVSQPGGYGNGTRSGMSKGSGSMPDGRSELFTVASLVGVLSLLILAAACGNLGSLLLARGVAREREISIRSAVGAGSGRLIRQLFTESLLLALLGSLAGLGLGYVVLRGVMMLAEAPRWIDATPDWRVIAFAIAAGFVSAILFGLMPAFQVARQRHRASLTRQILIGAQVAASCVLLVVAGLLVRAVTHIMSTHPGFDYEHVLSISPGLAGHGYSPAQAQTYLQTLQSRLRELPGVESVSLAVVSPLGNSKIVMSMDLAGRETALCVNRIDPQYFETMKIPILRGRSFAPGDTRAVIVSASAALRAWPGEEAVGKTMAIGADASGGPLQFTVVGVSGNARVVAMEDPDAVEIYFPAETSDLPSMNVVLKTSTPPESLAPSVVSIARGLDTDVFPEVQILKSAFRRKLQAAERSALGVSLLGISALLLACLGIVGLVAYAVSQRTKEIGIRLALGATRSHVLLIVLRQFSRPVVAGLFVGMAGAAATSQILRRELYGISSLDPTAYLAAIGIFVITVALAALFPARRALRVDPLRALRFE